MKEKIIEILGKYKNYILGGDIDEIIANEIEFEFLCDHPEIGEADMNEDVFAQNVSAEVEKRIEERMPINFWQRLEDFVSDIRVSDYPGQEEKEMILSVCNRIKR